MAQAIQYCDRCGKLISPAEISKGAGIVTERVSVCETCAASLTPEQRAALRGTPEAREQQPTTEHRMAPGVRRPTASTRRRPPAPRAAEPASSSGLMALVGVLGGVGVGVTVALLLSGGSPDEKAPPADPAAVAPPVVPSSPVVPAPVAPAPADPGEGAMPAPRPDVPPRTGSDAAGELAKARALIDDRLDKYEDARAALLVVARDFAGTPAGTEAVRLVAEIDAKHMKLADAALADAERAAEELLAKGKKREALSLVRAVAARFRGTEWYRSKGEAGIEAAVAALDGAGAATPTSVDVGGDGPGGYVRGLKGTYYRGKGPGDRTKAFERIDTEMSFDWLVDEPMSDAGVGTGEDNFSIRWEGEINLPMDAMYTFYSEFDDMATVSVGGQDLGLPRNGNKSVRLPPGWHSIVIELVEGTGRARMILAISGGGMKKHVIAGDMLRSRAGASVVAAGDDDEGGDEVLASVVYNPAKKARDMSLWSHAETTVDGVNCIYSSKSDGKSDGAKYYVHVKMSDDLRFKLTDENGAPRQKLRLRTTFLDRGTRSWTLQYGKGKQISIKRRDTGEWQTETVDLPEATFPSKNFGGNDFRLCSQGWNGGEDLYVSSVELLVDRPVEENGEDAADEAALPTGPAEPLPGETGEPGQWAPGLIGEYFKGKGFKERVAVRIDRHLDLNFGWTYTEPAAGTNKLTIRWTGWVLIPADGVYEFHTDADDWMNVDIDGKRIVGGRGGRKSGRKRFAAGLHPIKVVYYEYDGEGRYYLKWVPPGETKSRNVGSGLLFHRVPEPGAMGPPAKTVGGLWAEYFVGENFDRKVAEGPIRSTKIEAGTFPFCSSLPPDHFSMRITGTLLEPKSREREYGLRVDGGVRVKIDDEVLYDHWDGVSGYQKQKKRFSGGHRKLLIEYRNSKGPARFHLQWKSGDSFKDVFGSHMYHEARPAEVIDRDGLAPGIRETYYRGPRPGGRPLGTRFGTDATFWSGTNSPMPGVPGGTHAAIARGVLLVPKKGVYLFRMRRSGGMQVSVGGRRLLAKWDAKSTWESARAALRAGPQPFVVAYSAQGKAEFRVLWAGPDFAFRRIGSGDVAVKADELVVAPPWEDAEADVAADDAGGPAVPGAGANAPAEPMPEGNLVVNGDFEKVDADTNFAERWTSHQWGAGGVNYSARLDRGNPRGGERSLAVRSTGDGALPGAFTTLSVALPAGKYTISFYACADVDETARVHAKLGEHEIESATVKEDFARVTGTVTITERMSRATLRIWTSSARMRVWFDDVEVRAAK